MNCKKCGENNWGTWTSTKSLKLYSYCRICRRAKAITYVNRQRAAEGKHTHVDWLKKLKAFNTCPKCNRTWTEIPKRNDKRYKYVWTKDHIIPLNQGGSDYIDNLQPLCYQCNFGKR